MTAALVGATVSPKPAPSTASCTAMSRYEVSPSHVKPIAAYAIVAATRPATTGGPYHVRSVRRPPTYAVRAIDAVSTARTQPEMSADRSRSTSTALTKIGTSTIAITSAAPTTKLANNASRRLRPPNRRSVDQRVVGAAQVPDERCRGDERDRVQPSEIWSRSTRQLVEPGDALDLRVAEQCEVERHQKDRDEHRTDPVDVRRALRMVVTVERPPRDRQPDNGERDVQPELPLPRQKSNEHRAVQRTPHPAERLDRAEHAEGTRPRAFRIHVTDHGERHRHHRTTADGGEHSADQERPDRCRCRDDDGADDEQRVGRDERAPPADDVADASGDRHDRDERDEVGVDDPRGVVEAVG